MISNFSLSNILEFLLLSINYFYPHSTPLLSPLLLHIISYALKRSKNNFSISHHWLSDRFYSIRFETYHGCWFHIKFLFFIVDDNAAIPPGNTYIKIAAQWREDKRVYSHFCCFIKLCTLSIAWYADDSSSLKP